MRKLLRLSFYLYIVIGCACKKVFQPANTKIFEATINGKDWMPGGYNNGGPNLHVYYLPSNQGTLNVAAYRQINTEPNITDLGFYIDSTNYYSIPHTFMLTTNSNAGLDYTENPCTYSSEDSLVQSTGSITITKLDTNAITGTFSAIFIKAGCDTINITNGRFDF